MPAHDGVPEELMHNAMLPTGTEVASYATHAEAQAAVDYLSEHEFDIRDVTIVGVDPHLVEHITGRLTPARVAFGGATSGLLWGAFFGLMMSFLNESLPGNGWIAVGLAGGAMMGMLMALVTYMMRGGKRDFVSHTHVVAARYAVLAERDAQRAFDLLQKTAGNQRRPSRPRPTRTRDTGPTEYGSRPDEKPRFGVRMSDLNGSIPAKAVDSDTSASSDSLSTQAASDKADSPTPSSNTAPSPSASDGGAPLPTQDEATAPAPGASADNPYAPPKD